ncbi:MAG: tRNA1(Val) (adenine(37)-N6)-methyltransferase [Lachnospiraceae bacterium]|nr:tRNA1(Val) (adenine(37)-N6)-methyltransferase [Lachnospiraceae bacterium]
MTAESYKKEGERIDDLQRNGLKILQDPRRFCFGMDAVLLSGFAKVRKDERVLDLGTGTGILPLLLSAKTEGREFVGLEVQAESADMAERSVRMNGLTDRIRIVRGNVRNAEELFGPSSFDVVVSNPPYMIDHHGIQNPNDAKLIARHEVLAGLEDFIQQTARILRPKGRCYFVHRPFRLADLIVLMRQYGLEPKRMRLVYPFVDREPNMVLLEGVRNGNPRLTVEKPLIVYKAVGQYTDEIHDLYGF